MTVNKRYVPSEQWRPFFDGLSRRWRGRPINIGLRGWRSDLHMVARSLPLIGVTVDRSGDNDDAHEVIEVMAGDSEANVNHVVHRPIRVEVLESGNGHDNVIVIEPASGRTVEIDLKASQETPGTT